MRPVQAGAAGRQLSDLELKLTQRLRLSASLQRLALHEGPTAEQSAPIKRTEALITFHTGFGWSESDEL